MGDQAMLSRLRLERFKNFEDAELALGPLTVLVGANASGKSNVRDAFRFLHGIGRGYTLAEIIGEKWGEGGVLQWRGIRGGTREAAFDSGSTFAVEVELPSYVPALTLTYRIQVDLSEPYGPPRVAAERLTERVTEVVNRHDYLFDSDPPDGVLRQDGFNQIKIRMQSPNPGRNPSHSFLSQQPVLPQILEIKAPIVLRESTRAVMAALSRMRFLDLVPDAMRLPSLPGQTVLGDRGENLSSVLLDICADEQQKQTLTHWLRELTPMDARDFEFPRDQTGRVLVSLVEESGQRTSAYSASDGTLRFLAMVAALLAARSGDFFFFEELENGIHPTRLHLLLQLIEQVTQERGVRVVATSHSPLLLTLLSRETLEYASLIYRLPGQRDARITRILDIPEARRVIDEQDIGRLFASGWLDDTVAFREPAGALE
jgi:predicted ATPase